MDIVGKIKGWLHQPFDSEMDATGWFLFVGLLIAISVLWNLILRHLANI